MSSKLADVMGAKNVARQGSQVVRFTVFVFPVSKTKRPFLALRQLFVFCIADPKGGSVTPLIVRKLRNAP